MPEVESEGEAIPDHPSRDDVVGRGRFHRHPFGPVSPGKGGGVGGDMVRRPASGVRRQAPGGPTRRSLATTTLKAAIALQNSVEREALGRARCRGTHPIITVRARPVLR
ncbi:hypothetical protein JCM4914_73680 [Streptomyces platensis subsp. malvinus]